jgi:N-acetylneuraminic acid mutarotase
MIYTIGGAEVVWTAQVEMYDPKSDHWTQIAPLPTARGAVGAAAAFGRIYAIGGAHNTGEYATVEEYNPATDEWRRVADLPATRAGAGVCTTRGKVYAVGGFVGRDDRFRAVDTLFEYDAQRDVWTERAPLPKPRSFVTAVSVGGRVFAIGGTDDGSGVWDSMLDTVEEYNPLTDTWTATAPLPCAVYGASAVAIGSTIYVVLGWTAKGFVSRVFKYDTGLSPST